MDEHAAYITQAQQEEFEAFLMGNMSAENAVAFEAELAKNPGMQMEFEEFKALFNTIEEKALRAVLDDFHENTDRKRATMRFTFNGYRIAAMVAVLIALGLWFFNQQSSNEQLFETYFSPDPGLPTVMGTSDNYAFYEAMVDYKQGHYKKAINKWKAQLNAKPHNDTLNYFLGMSHLALKDQTKAIPYLEEVSERKGGFFERDALYFLGMAHLKNNNPKTAKQYLAQSGHSKSEIVLSELNN